MRRLVGLGLAASLALALPVVLAAPASAASMGVCVVAGSACTTGTVGATSDNYIYWEVMATSLPGCNASWKVWDVNTKVVVGHGNVGWGITRSGVIRGLVGSYKGRVFDACPLSTMEIRNY